MGILLMNHFFIFHFYCYLCMHVIGKHHKTFAADGMSFLGSRAVG